MNILKLPAFSGALLMAISLIGCGEKSETETGVVRNVILTEVEQIGENTAKSFSGVVEEGKTVSAAFMTGGKLMTLQVKEGDRVKKGQLLASLDDTDYLIGVNQLTVQFDQMTSEKKRMDEMFARHNIAPNDYEKFQAGYKQLELQLEMARNKLGYTKLYSPSDGFISYKYMEPGELVDAGTPIYRIADDSSLEVSVDLPISVYRNRGEIKEAYGLTAGEEERIPLKIESFNPDADNNQLYHMKLEIPRTFSDNLTAGMNMTVVIEMHNEIKGESLIPSRAIFDDNGMAYVWVFETVDSTLSKKAVTVVGEPVGAQSMVTGLSGNEKIVSAGVKQLKEGEKVNVIPGVVKSN